MANMEEKIPNSTKILFLLDILKNHKKENLAENQNVFYETIKDIEANGVKFNYIKYYEFKKEKKVYNSMLNKDLTDLIRSQKIEFIGANTIKIRDFGRELVGFFKSLYGKTYRNLEKAIEFIGYKTI